ncbi:MAG: dockerin type I domain-containing protein [Planctomycetota bacterium]
MKFLIAFFCLVSTFSSLAAQELITNGDFEAGNVSFGSDLLFDSSPPFINFNGQYAIGNNSSDWSPTPGNWADLPDHTTGKGLMQIATPAFGEDRVWFQTVTVKPNSTYRFRGWAAHVTNTNPAILSINAGSTSIGVFDLSIPPPATWAQFDFVWESHNQTVVELSITDLQTTGSGNDFTLDDLSFAIDNEDLIGDANCDGEVNLLDVAPFVEAISTGVFILKADVNQDGSVDLLDVAPFVDLLTGG